MKPRARNPFGGKVVALLRNAVNDEVVLRTGAGQEIAAIVTNESAKRLGLTAGRAAAALAKASGVLLVVA